MRKHLRYLVLVSAWFVGSAGASEPDAAAIEFFETKVRPVLVDNCFGCHGEKKQQAGLRLDSRQAMLAGGDSGPALVAGDAGKSRLIQAIQQSGDLKMPPKGKLKAEEVEAISKWVAMSAPWPAASVKPATATNPSRDHWAFQPVKRPALPDVKQTQSMGSPVDAFILAKLDAAGIAPSSRASKQVLIRRASIDLTGLPPSPEEIADFLADESPEAFGRVVDRLLASPRYGERWARYWLDVSRYADSKGYVFTEERRYAFAYTYRDYVINALNTDKPYDRFIVEQLAADRLDTKDDKRSLAAMGFLTLGRRFLNNQPDIIDDRIDVVTRGLLGLTVSCARCHDHKFDPIPTKDYYSLYGVFQSSVEPGELPLIAEPRQSEAYSKYEAEQARLKGEVTKFRDKKRAEIADVQRMVTAITAQGLGAITVAAAPQAATLLPPEKFDRLLNRKEQTSLKNLIAKAKNHEATSPAAPPRAMVLNDAAKPSEPHVFVRGNTANLGPKVPRQFLGVLAGENRQPFTNGSGRLELAQAIANPANPLTARVFVNRLWANHFGQGLVAMPSDFGVRTERPVHSELLDWLASEFVERGWSIKHLHRLIMMSAAYQQQSDERTEPATRDPENRLLWRYPRRRLDFEAMRDGLLAMAGRLDPAIGGPPVDIANGTGNPRRTIYGYIDRQNLPGMFRTFDFASPDTHAPQRYVTTVPQQALFLLNSPFAGEQTKALLSRPEIAAQSQPELKIDSLYRLVLGRPASSDEIQLGLDFLASVATDADTKLTLWERYGQVLLLTNEFAFVD